MRFCSFLLFAALSTALLPAQVTYVSSQQEFDDAHDNAGQVDTIVWLSGTYSDILMEIDNDSLYITAEVLGGTIFTGDSRVDITGDHITIRGFQFLNGDIGTEDVIHTRGSYNVFTEINIADYRSYKYLRVREESQYCVISYCNFENRLNLDDQNILSLLVDDNQPGYHKIQYCSFKNFDGTGNDMGIEPIRIGVSTQADFISRSVVEYCYFTQCNGDGELISSKATQNVYRYNTFENNPKAELVLRHGSEAIVYGNFFLQGKGGVRVREGQDHYIYNNYFENLDDRAIFLQNEDSDPLDNIQIAFNTIVDCSEIILGGSGNDKPTNVTFANNIFSEPDDDLFEDPTGTETWIGNIAFGSLGMTLPVSGIIVADPMFVSNGSGLSELDSLSPAIDGAQAGYAPLPAFMGIDGIDTAMMLDIMMQSRPAVDSAKDLGCSEYPHLVPVQPIATEENTGPSYLGSSLSVGELWPWEAQFSLAPNPAANELRLNIQTEAPLHLSIAIYTLEGKQIKSVGDQQPYTGDTEVRMDIADLPNGMYLLQILNHQAADSTQKFHALKFLKQ
ncbi:chondroitinase-B domain-containing protein [Pontibacter sp. G13]|uniref:chondroitinase-B domain-containing protein n=1 Tax=Pontibacter sp. G13 TaxID=3074898 RepID=UPI002889212F|nr:chondroitinase-B domain-containing protein [Pontibacter sp. G13]WNJ17869.1 chondroitinase-B domain-containing protein [Pontibacter sp. G13]